MALDVRNGDVLVADGVEYPVRSCGVWEWPPRSFGLRRLLTRRCDIRRAVLSEDGRLSGMETTERGIACLPLDPVDAETAERVGIRTPGQVVQTTLDGGEVFYQLVLERL